MSSSMFPAIDSASTGREVFEKMSAPKKTEKSAALVVFAAMAALALIAIIFIVIGACGVSGAIPMAPIGGEIMVVLGVGTILGMISGAVKVFCK